MTTDLLTNGEFLSKVVNAIPKSILTLDATGRICHLNNYLKEVLNTSNMRAQGHLTGEVIGCLHMAQSPDHICGNELQCKKCVLHQAANNALKNHKTEHRKGFFSLVLDGNALNISVSVTASPLSFNQEEYVVLLIDNIPLPHEHRMAARPEFDKYRIIGDHPQILELHKLIAEAARENFPVLIQAESGTGKELVAHSIHNQSSRHKKPFVAINCASLPKDLLESELFGHVKGSFTSAYQDKKGRFEIADQGTVFLDEIGELAPDIQAKLLRFIQDGTFERVGGNITTQVDVRFIAATNKELSKEVSQGKFRLDLFYRLNVIPMTIPPLRERKQDVSLLTQYFMERYDNCLAHEKRCLSKEALKFLTAYSWPGNVRELQNAIKFALMKCNGGEIKVHHLPMGSSITGVLPPIMEHEVSSSKIDKASLCDALRMTQGNKTDAAEILGVSRMTVYRYIKKYFKEHQA